MNKGFALGVVAAAMLLSSCGTKTVTCSDDSAKAALESAIREGLEKVAIAHSKGEDGTQSISNSAIRAAISNIKLIVENIRTTKEDPNSTKRFCTGNLKIVFPTEVFKDADRARELSGLGSVEQMADGASIEKGADYLKGDLDYNVQPTDDGKMVFAEFENANDKLAVFGEVVAASLAKSRIESEARAAQEQLAATQREQENAASAEQAANLEQANLLRSASEDALMVAWKSLTPAGRQNILAQQRIWIKQKDASCKVRGLQSSTVAMEQKVSEFRCQAEQNESRTAEILRIGQEEF